MRHMKTLLHSLKIIFTFIFLFFARPYHALLYYFNRQGYYHAAHLGFRFILFCVNVKVLLSGRENLPKPTKRYMIVANHQSYFDIHILSSILPCTFIQRPIPYIPGYFWHFGKLSLIIDRDSASSIMKAIRYVKKVVLTENTPVAMFPEATRSEDGSLSRFQLGAAVIAKKLGISILPISIFDSRFIMPKGSMFSSSADVHTSVQPLIDSDYIKNHSPEEITQEIKQRIEQGLNKLGQSK